ncbi:hypothetical protein [Polymorphospora rubra]|uniref:hypothetical protein n=1 Tax=Polymorphospora rubra TaxID=338584 RepID=UPI003CCEF545
MGPRRAATTLAALLLAGAGATVGAAPAHAAGTAGYCPDANGVTVIVDFRELGGATIIRCAPGNQATGLAALKNAGIQITGTARWGEGFICRIEGRPGPQSEPCIDTPPASAYWSYWHAPNGGTWSYSQFGVLNRTPPPGSFEGWSFSKDRTSSSSPPPRVAPRRPAAPAPTRTTAGPPPGGQPGAPPPAASRPADPPPGAPAPSRPASPPAAPTGPATTQATTPPTPAGPTSGGAPATTDPGPAPTPTGTDLALPPEPAAHSGGGRVPFVTLTFGGVPFATLAGGVLLVALVGGAVWTARRRRAATGTEPPEQV